jgi:hypothetical protein
VTVVASVVHDSDTTGGNEMRAETEQGVIGDDIEHEHIHTALTHMHDHWHVSHEHKTGQIAGVFDHRSHHHIHEHNHAAIDHAHEGRDAESELRKHNEMAHTHDHERPTG